MQSPAVKQHISELRTKANEHFDSLRKSAQEALRTPTLALKSLGAYAQYSGAKCFWAAVASYKAAVAVGENRPAQAFSLRAMANLVMQARKLLSSIRLFDFSSKITIISISTVVFLGIGIVTLNNYDLFERASPTKPPPPKPPPPKPPVSEALVSIYPARGIPTFWRKGSASKMAAGLDQTPASLVDLGEVCGLSQALMFSAASLDGTASTNRRLARKRAEVLALAVYSRAKNCRSQRPQLFAVAMYLPRAVRGDGVQRVAIGVGNPSPNQAPVSDLLRRAGKGGFVRTSDYANVEICELKKDEPCDWQPAPVGDLSPA